MKTQNDMYLQRHMDKLVLSKKPAFEKSEKVANFGVEIGLEMAIVNNTEVIILVCFSTK